VPLTINSNVASLNAQNRLGRSTDTLRKSFERLSSGLRITRASDDAAGLSVASNLRVDARIATQGIRNVNDAISYLSIAEGSMTELSSIITRIEELASQASNGTLTATQRRSLNSEAQALKSEYGRIASSTTFNDIALLTGENPTLTVQAGGSSVEFLSEGLGTGAIGDGTFQVSHSFASGATPGSPIVADFNGDGIQDMASVDTTSARFGVFLGNGDGSFKARQSFTTGSNTYAIATADLNGDGVLDMVSADSGANSVGVFIGNGNGTFKARTQNFSGFAPRSLTIDDFNGDGIKDIVSGDFSAYGVSVFFGVGDGTFSTRVSYRTGTISNIVYSVKSADLNGDGVLDLVTADANQSSVVLLLGNSGGTFNAPLSFVTGATPQSVAIRDLNGDGNLDLVSADGGAGRLSVLLGNGNGTFKARTSLSTGTTPVWVTTSDFNGDGLYDLVSADTGTSSVSVFLGNGNGTFQSRVSYVVGANPNSIAVADLDGDDIKDIVASAGSGLSVILGNGTAASVLNPFSLLTAADALDTLDEMDAARTELSKALGDNGAQQSRLQSIISTLQVRGENYEAAASQILDVDVAEDAALLARSQILQQAGAAVLAQANIQPRLALSLLGSA